MQQLILKKYLNLTKKEYTKKYLREEFDYQKLLKEARNSFGISSRGYYAVYYYSSDTHSQIYIRNREEFEELLAGEGVDELFIEKREEKEEEVLEDSGKRNNKIVQNNLFLIKFFEEMKRKYNQSITNLEQESKKEVSKTLLKKQQYLKIAYQRKMKRSLQVWGEKCSFCRKRIKGVKYECASCELISCEGCERDQKHALRRSHVFIKINNEKHGINKKHLQMKFQEGENWCTRKQQQPPKQNNKNNDINTLVQFLSISQGEALELITKNPNKQVDQLINMHMK